MLDILRNATKKQLLDRAWLEDAIGKLGLGNRPSEFPPGMHRLFGGLSIWQYPNQAAPYLIELADKDIRRYAEVGLFQGGMFILTVEYLSRFTPVELALGIDKELTPEVREYAAQNPAVELVEDLSCSWQALRAIQDAAPLDLVFIDADHEEKACRSDYEMVKDYTRFVGFHDLVEWTCPGVANVWRDVTGRKFEFCDQYPGVSNSTYGIGLVERDGS